MAAPDPLDPAAVKRPMHVEQTGLNPDGWPEIRRRRQPRLGKRHFFRQDGDWWAKQGRCIWAVRMWRRDA